MEINHTINFADISHEISAFEGKTYPVIADICSANGRPLIGHEPCDCSDACLEREATDDAATSGYTATWQVPGISVPTANSIDVSTGASMTMVPAQRTVSPGRNL